MLTIGGQIWGKSGESLLIIASVISSSPPYYFNTSLRMTWPTVSVHLLLSRTWMAGLTLVPQGSGSLAKLQLLHELLCLRSGCTQGCRMFREQTKERQFKKSPWTYVYLSNSIRRPITRHKLRLMGQNTIYLRSVVGHKWGILIGVMTMSLEYTKPSMQVYSAKCIG